MILNKQYNVEFYHHYDNYDKINAHIVRVYHNLYNYAANTSIIVNYITVFTNNTFINVTVV